MQTVTVQKVMILHTRAKSYGYALTVIRDSPILAERSKVGIGY